MIVICGDGGLPTAGAFKQERQALVDWPKGEARLPGGSRIMIRRRK